VIWNLLTAAGAVGAGSAVTPLRDHHNESQQGTIGIKISATATCKIEGSFDNVTWFQLASVSANAAQLVPLCPFMRANVTAWTSGTVDAWLFE
jgi:hypothetical protein